MIQKNRLFHKTYRLFFLYCSFAALTIDCENCDAEDIELNAKQFYIADVNNDGNVDVLDGSMIQKYVVEKIHEFPKKA